MNMKGIWQDLTSLTYLLFQVFFTYARRDEK